MAKVTIRTKKYQTRAQAEWRCFNAAMLDGKHTPKDVIKAMIDPETIKQAKKWLRQETKGYTKAELKASQERQLYINRSKKIDKEIKHHIDENKFNTTLKK